MRTRYGALGWAMGLVVLLHSGCASQDADGIRAHTTRPPGHRPDAAAERLAYDRMRRLPQGMREFPMDAYTRAQQQTHAMRTFSTAADRFVERESTNQAKASPAPRWQFLGPTNIAGRTRALEFDPRNPDRMILGAVSGGLWVSENGGSNWSLLTDTLANVNIGALAIDQTHPDTMYVGTGEIYRFSGQPYSAMWGQGMFRSTDGGRTFQHLLATTNDNFRYVADIVISRHNARRLYVATNSGVWRSNDGGATFAPALAPVDGQGNRQFEGCTDLLLLPHDSRDVLLASCASRSRDDRYYLPGTIYPPACGEAPCPAVVYRADDAATAVDITGGWRPVLSETGMGRTSLDYARSNPNIVYGVSASIVPGPDRTGDGIGDYDNGLHAVWRSNDGGNTWTAQVRNTSTDKLSTYLLSYADSFDSQSCGWGAPDPYSAGWYNQAIAVNPINPEVVWVAGMEHYRSEDGGRSFGKASYWFLFDEFDAQGVHADQHLMKFHPNYNGTTNTQLYSTNDGGLTVTINDTAATTRGNAAACGPTTSNPVGWLRLTNGLGTTQFYTGAVTADGTQYMGGLQDNGTLLNDSNGENMFWRHVWGGDGAHVAIDPRNANTLYASSQNINLVRSVDRGRLWSSATSGINDVAIFIVPFVLDPSAPDRLYLGGTRVWRTDNQGRSWRAISSAFGSSFDHRTSAIAVAPSDPNRMLAGNQVGIYRNAQTLNAGSSTNWSATSPRGGWVSSLIFDPNNANVAYATYSTFGGQHVWRTADAGASWTAIDGSGAGRLPDIPVHSLAVHPTNGQRLYIGTDLGVFVTIDGGQNWAVENTGFANAITETVVIPRGGTQLYAFTYGRGVWRVPLTDLDGVASYQIGDDISGAFYDAAQDGQGWMLETLTIDGVRQLLAAWYVYLDGEQRWLIGTGPVTGGRARVDLYIGRAGEFPPNFDPNAVRVEPWGTAEFNFEDTNTGSVSWTTNYAGFNNGSMPLTRLSRPSAANAESATGRIAACHSGNWFNAGQSGHGLQVQVLGEPGSRQMLAVWYTYLGGAQRWLIAQGPVSGDTATMTVLMMRGADFPPNFVASQVERINWGALSFRAIDANRAQISWNTTQPGFSNGSLDLVRLSTLSGNTCP